MQKDYKVRQCVYVLASLQRHKTRFWPKTETEKYNFSSLYNLSSSLAMTTQAEILGMSVNYIEFIPFTGIWGTLFQYEQSFYHPNPSSANQI